MSLRELEPKNMLCPIVIYLMGCGGYTPLRQSTAVTCTERPMVHWCKALSSRLLVPNARYMCSHSTRTLLEADKQMCPAGLCLCEFYVGGEVCGRSRTSGGGTYHRFVWYQVWLVARNGAKVCQFGGVFQQAHHTLLHAHLGGCQRQTNVRIWKPSSVLFGLCEYLVSRYIHLAVGVPSSRTGLECRIQSRHHTCAYYVFPRLGMLTYPTPTVSMPLPQFINVSACKRTTLWLAGLDQAS